MALVLRDLMDQLSLATLSLVVNTYSLHLILMNLSFMQVFRCRILKVSASELLKL